jgi:hypothetical protein
MPSLTSYGYKLNRLPQAPLNRESQPDLEATIPFSEAHQQIPDASLEISKLEIKSGKTNFTNDETGILIGVDAGVPKVYVGDDTNYLNWTGTGLIIVGELIEIDTGTGAIKGQVENLITDVLGENVTAGDVLYLKTADSKWYIADASAQATADNSYGVASESGSTDETKKIQIGGSVPTVSGLSAAGLQYLSDTGGEVSTTPGTFRKVIGFSYDGSSMILFPVQRHTHEPLTGRFTKVLTGSGNFDQAITTNGTPQVIEIELYGVSITNDNAAYPGTNSFSFRSKTKWQGSTFKSDERYLADASSGMTLANYATAPLGTLTAYGATPATIGHTFVLSIQSLSSTGFTIRLADTVIGGGPGTPTITCTYRVWM